MITPSFGLTATERVLPKLALDFTTASLDSRVTFTRTTDATHPATYVNSSGVVTAATNNQPRFDYDPVTLACKGLLIEESRSNLLQQSNGFDDAYWTKTAVAANAAATISPDGTNNAFSLVETTANSEHRILKSSITVSQSTAYTVTVYAKARANRSLVVYMLYGSNGWVGIADLTTGTITQSSTIGTGVGSATILSAGNGWYRFSVTYTTAATANTLTVSIGCSNGTTSSYTGDGTSGIYIWGAQFEAGAFATSYIPTTTTAVTRNADVAVMTGTNFSDWFNPTEGTFVVDAIPISLAGSSKNIFNVNDGTTNNFIRSYYDGSNRWVACRNAGITTFAPPFSSATAGQKFGVSLAYKVGSYAAAVDGGTPSTGSNASAIVSPIQMNIGSTSAAASFLNGHITALNYYPQRLTNAEVQATSR